MSRPGPGLLGVMLALGLVGCGIQEKPLEQQGACGDSSQCEAGQACQDGVCIAATCFSTTDCPLGSVCDEATYACVDGCEVESDCFAGQDCSDGACVEGDGTCETTEIDCPLGHECSGGECSIPDDPFCMPCDRVSDCTTAGGGDDFACYQLSSDSPAVCGIPCEADSECPQGFWCGSVDLGGYSVLNCLGACDQL